MGVDPWGNTPDTWRLQWRTCSEHVPALRLYADCSLPVCGFNPGGSTTTTTDCSSWTSSCVFDHCVHTQSRSLFSPVWAPRWSECTGRELKHKETLMTHRNWTDGFYVPPAAGLFVSKKVDEGVSPPVSSRNCSCPGTDQVQSGTNGVSAPCYSESVQVRVLTGTLVL